MNNNRISHLIERWIIMIQRFRFGVFVLIALITLLSLWLIVNHLGMTTDTRDMLSRDLKWRQLDIKYEDIFTETLDNVLIVIEADTPDRAREDATKLYTSLKASPYFIEDIYFPSAISFFRETAFLFMTEDELYDLSSRLTKIQPFIGTLLSDQSLRGFFNMLEQVFVAKADGEEIDLSILLSELNKTLKEKEHRLSWQTLLQADTKNKSVYREFIITKILKDPDELLPSETAIQYIKGKVNRLGLEDGGKTSIRLSGNAALAYEELKSVAEANVIAIITSIILVAILLIIGLRSLWLFFSSIITLILGLIATTALAAFTVGVLNLISVAFAVLYIGLGIDFAIHLCLRFKEVQKDNRDTQSALRFAAISIFRTLFLCALTTSIGFYSFMPTDYQGVAELGWIAGCGMLISLFYTFTLLPALLSFEKKTDATDKSKSSEKIKLYLSELPYKNYKSILVITAILIIVASFSLNHLRFDSNTLNLQDQNNESVKTFQDLLKDKETSPWFVVTLEKDKARAELAKSQFEAIDIVNDVVWLNDLVPKNQEEKLFIVDDLNLLMGPLFQTQSSVATKNDERLKITNNLLSILKQYPLEMKNDQIIDLQKQLEYLVNHPIELIDIEKRLLYYFVDSINLLETGLAATNVELSDVPDEIKARWYKKGFYKLEIYPEKDLNDHDAMIEFVRELQKHDDAIIGPPVVNVEAGAAVIKSFQSAILYALIAITILLLILIKSKVDVVLILGTLFTGSLFSMASMALINQPINFANIIGLPLLLGIGVDSAIHIVNRFREDQENDKNLFLTSAFRGVLVSSFTTIFSIGNLAFSKHAGTASMGIMLTIGLLCMMFATVVVLPSFLIWLDKR